MSDRLGEDGPSPSTGERLVYAIGDIHGRLDALRALLDTIEADVAARQPALMPTLVFLGDYIDRGPQSREVIETILALKAAGAFEVIALMGNHEQMLLDFLSDGRVGPRWAVHGGRETLNAYGVEARPPARDAEGWDQVRATLQARLPASHLFFIRGLETARVIGDFVFVHAGIRPGVALADQSRDDLLWIRAPFLESHARHEKVVVHGHTPTQEPFDGAHRIGVDTGAYATGRLTAVRLDGGTRAFLQSAPGRVEGGR